MKEVSSVGLVGDGDEVDAIQCVERHFNVSLDYNDAPRWLTAGDVFESLLAKLPPNAPSEGDLWSRFATILCEDTAVDPARIRPETPLFRPGR